MKIKSDKGERVRPLVDEARMREAEREIRALGLTSEDGEAPDAPMVKEFVRTMRTT